MSTNPRCGVCCRFHAPRCVATDRRWPIAPLLALYGGSVRSLAAKVAASHEVVYRAIEEGLSDAQADRWAIRCGMHPEQVWAGWCEAALTVLDDLHVNGGGWRQAWLFMERENPVDVEREVA